MINTIYILKNKCNDKVYIGQTWQSLKDRWSYGQGYRGCLKIEGAIEKYGKDNFYYEILTFCGTQDTADYWETYFINKYDSINNGYNICPSGNKGSMIGRKHSESSRIKMSNSRKGIFVGENNPFWGKHHSEETKLKISNSLIGKSNHWLGRKHSDASKEKISKAGKEQRRSIDTEFKPGKIWTPHSATKLNLEIAENIRKDHMEGMTGISIANKYHISKASVSRIINNKSWNK